MAPNTHVSAEQLAADIRAGTIDTVIVAFADHQGRVIGKRTDGDFYLDVVVEEGTENCDYLIACDLDDVPIPGFTWASYEQGYGDMRGVVDPSTIRYLPWLESTALVLVDLVDIDTGAAVEVSPRRILQRQVEAAAELGYTLDDRQRGRVLRVPGAVRRRQRQGLPGPDAELSVGRGLQHPADEQGGGPARAHPSWAARGRLPGRVLQGRGGAGPARAEPDVPAGVGDGRHQPGVQERRQGDRRAGRAVGDVHGQAALRRRRQQRPHPFEPVDRARAV